MVDDTDTQIVYSGTWITDHGSQDNFGNIGPEYNHTLHGTTVTGTNLTYVFNGNLMFKLHGFQRYG
jgi:hypothetical protein